MISTAGKFARRKNWVSGRMTPESVDEDIRNLRQQLQLSNNITSIINVLDFGVIGDGVTDNTSAIQSLIDSASSSNGVVFFPPGTYICKSRLVAKSNCTLLGAGKYLSTLSLPQSNINPMDFSLIENTSALSNFSVISLGFLGNRSVQTTSFTSSSNDGFAIGFLNGPISNVLFEDLYIREFGATGGAKNTGGGAIVIVPTGSDSTCTNIQCRNVVFGNNDKVPGFYLDSSEGTVGGGNNIVVRGCIFSGGGNNNAVYALGGYGASSSKRIYNVLVCDNLFYITEDLDSCVEVNGVYGFSINNNKYVFTSTGVGQVGLIRSDCFNGSFSFNQIASFNSSTTKPVLGLLAFNNGEFQNNIVIEGNSWFIDNSAFTDLVKILKGSRRVVFKNNIFFGNTSTISRAVDIGECTDIEAVGNQFENVSTCFFIAAGTNPSTARIGIRQNRLNNCGGSGVFNITTTGGTISLTEVEIEDNVVTNPKSTAGGAVFCGLSVSANTGNILRDNKVYGGLAVTDATTEWAHIENNIGYNPVGISTITVTASPFTYTAGVTHETVYIYGGTVSDVSVGGSTVATASPTQVQLPAGVAVVITYTVAPTMKKYIH